MGHQLDRLIPIPKSNTGTGIGRNTFIRAGIGGKAGYTLLEILLTVLVVSFGITVIFPLLLKTSSYLHDLQSRQDAGILLNNLLVDAREYTFDKKSLEGWPMTGEFEMHKRQYHYSADIQAVTSDPRLMEVTIRMTWDYPKHGQLSKAAFVFAS